MRKLLLVIVVAVLPASIAEADPSGTRKDKDIVPSKLLPVRRSVNNCAAYGVGFVKVDGTDTCVKIGGAVRVDVGGSR